MSQQPVGICHVCKKPVVEKDPNIWVKYQENYYHLDHPGVKEWYEAEMKKESKKDT